MYEPKIVNMETGEVNTLIPKKELENLHAEIERLNAEMRELKKHKDRIYLENVMIGDELAECMECNFNAVDEINLLKTAIRETLADNGHLADGDNCTLIKLKRTLERTGR